MNTLQSQEAVAVIPEAEMPAITQNDLRIVLLEAAALNASAAEIRRRMEAGARIEPGKLGAYCDRKEEIVDSAPESLTHFGLEVGPVEMIQECGEAFVAHATENGCPERIIYGPKDKPATRTDYDRGVNDAALAMKLALQLKSDETKGASPEPEVSDGTGEGDASAIRRNLPEMVRTCLRATDWEVETIAAVKAVLEAGPKKSENANQSEPPEWAQVTPDEPVYHLEMTIPGTTTYCDQHEQFILLTREEYLALKIHLCTLRGNPIPDHLRIHRDCLRLEREGQEQDRAKAAGPRA